MGGIFSSSEPEVVEPVDTNAIAEKAAEEERLELLERQRRGMDSTINTSYQGILSAKDTGLERKTLLGE